MRRTYKRKKGGSRNINNSKQNKICIIMSDNREISDDYENAEYHSLAVAINYNYAKKHGYNFIYYNPHIPQKHKVTNSNSGSNIKNKINSFQSKLNKYRYAPWTKLVTLFHTLLEKYKYVLYIDTDAIVVNNINLEKYLGEVTYFKGSTNSELKFLIISNSDIAKRAVKYWWNYDMPEFDKKHGYEQESLWSFINNKDLNIEPYIGIIDELSFEPKEGQYIRHVGTPDKERRVSIFKCYYETLYNKETFKNTIDEIKKNNVKKVDIIKLEEDLQKKII